MCHNLGQKRLHKHQRAVDLEAYSVESLNSAIRDI